VRDALADQLAQNPGRRNGQINESGGVGSVSAKVLAWRLSWTTKLCKTR
jgi:hypothetical protein